MHALRTVGRPQATARSGLAAPNTFVDSVGPAACAATLHTAVDYVDDPFTCVRHCFIDLGNLQRTYFEVGDRVALTRVPQQCECYRCPAKEPPVSSKPLRFHQQRICVPSGTPCTQCRILCSVSYQGRCPSREQSTVGQLRTSRRVLVCIRLNERITRLFNLKERCTWKSVIFSTVNGFVYLQVRRAGAVTSQQTKRRYASPSERAEPGSEPAS